MIVVDAAGVPDHPSGVRTRLRGLYQAYARLEEAPEVTIRVAHGAELLHGIEEGPVHLEEHPAPGGPVHRWLRRRSASPESVRLWHSETIPPLAQAGVPTLLTLHDLRWLESRSVTGGSPGKHALRRLGMGWLVPRLVRGLAGLVTVSRASSAAMQKAFGIAAERVHVVENAAVVEVPPLPSAAEREALRRRLWIPGEFLLAVGHLERRKGLEVVLEALARAEPGGRLGRAVLVLAGTGPERGHLVSLARRLDVSDRVRWPGSLADDEVHGLLCEAAVLVFPSRLEGFGFPVYEALARGCPVLAEPLEVLADLPEGGLRRCERDPAAWAAALESMLAERPAQAEAAALLARSLAERTWECSARKLAALYRMLLDANSA